MGETKTFDDLASSEAADILRGFCLTQIGTGTRRAVYTLAWDKKFVAKIELPDRASAQNRMEFEVWEFVKDSPTLARWFAPCHAISPSGMCLIQSRTKPVTRSELPRRVPRFFWDTKVGNWGRIGSRVVCHDYGLINIGMGVYTRRLKRADWWGDETSS